MPLMSLRRVYKTFPPTFADGFTQNAKERRENSKVSKKGGQHDVTRREQLKKKQADEVVFSGDVIKRQRTPCTDVEPADDISRSNKEYNTRTGKNADVKSKDVTSWWAFRPRSRDSNSRSGRTTVSLEMVDLWESDSEETEPADPSGFDRINGVLINPRKTFDFSELRRENQSRKIGENQDRRRSRKHVRQSEKEIANLEICDVELGENMMKIESRCSESDTAEAPSGELGPTLVDSNISVEKQKRKSVTERLLELKNKNLRKLREKSHEKESKTQIFEPRITKPKTCLITKPKTCLKQKTPEPSTKEAQQKKQTTSVPKVRPRVKVVPGLEDPFPSPRYTPSAQNTCAQSVANFPTRNNDVIHRGEETYPPTTQKRKVKFNKVVSVREDGRNRFDFLRTSKNSAQTFKQKYLSGIPARTIEEVRPTTPTPDMGRSIYS